jgi:hypothetical protein
MRVLSLAVLFFACGMSPAAAGQPQPLTTLEVTGLGTGGRKVETVTFGQVFKKGDVPDGVVLCNGGAAQADVKRRYGDGSVRFTVVTARLDTWGAGGTGRVALANGTPGEPAAPVTAKDLLATEFDARIAFTFPDGTVRTAGARALLEAAGDKARTWLHGPLVTEWLLDGPPLDANGKPDPDLHVRFQVRAYAGCRRVRVSVAVENVWDTWAGNIRYDAVLTVAGKPVFTVKGLNHRRLSRWRKVAWWGGEPNTHVKHDLAYIIATGALPNYDRTLDIPERRIVRRFDGWRKASQNLMGPGLLMRYMPSTGGRAEIGPYPSWTVDYLLTMDRRAKLPVLGQSDLAGAWPIHVRARKTGRVLSIDDRPEFWLDARGRDKPRWQDARTPYKEGRKERLTPDQAHQPSLAYVPYLVTGDYYHLEEAVFWANYCLISTWPHPRQKEKGILSGQIRGRGWALRNLADAEWILPDDAPERAYFAEKIRNTLAVWTGRMLDSPQTNPLGFHGFRSVGNARIKNAANPNWYVMVPWEHDYLIWSLHHATELGWAAAAKPRDYLFRWRVGTFVHAPDFDPERAAPYRMVVAERDPNTKKLIIYDDWKKVQAENERLTPKAGLPNYGCSYAYSGRGAVVCAVDTGFPKAAEALKVVESLLPGHREKMTRNPLWAIQPREK